MQLRSITKLKGEPYLADVSAAVSKLVFALLAGSESPKNFWAARFSDSHAHSIVSPSLVCALNPHSLGEAIAAHTVAARHLAIDKPLASAAACIQHH